MKYAISPFDGGFNLEIDFREEKKPKAFKANAWYATMPEALKFIQEDHDECELQVKEAADQLLMQAVHEQMMEVYQQYDAGIILVTEFVAKVREIEKLIPANVQGLIDPATGLRYP